MPNLFSHPLPPLAGKAPDMSWESFLDSLHKGLLLSSPAYVQAQQAQSSQQQPQPSFIDKLLQMATPTVDHYQPVNTATVPTLEQAQFNAGYAAPEMLKRLRQQRPKKK